GSSSLYFHQNSYTPEGDKLIFNTRGGIAAVDLTTLGVQPPKVELVAPGATAIATARRTREVYHARGGTLYATHLDTRVTREVAKVAGGGIAINADETIVAGTVRATDPSGQTPRPAPRPLLPQRERMFPGRQQLTPEEEASAKKEDGLARRLANPNPSALTF